MSDTDPSLWLIPLGELRFGHEAVQPFNARHADRDSDLAPLAASIDAHGLIHPLIVRRMGDEPFVVDGNRRLAALQLLLREGKIKPNYDVPAIETEANADEISLAANVMRAPLHDADRYEAFSKLADAGMTEADIAGRFGIEPQRVRRIMALGHLSPMILDAWRAGAFQQNPYDCVRSFTLASSVAEQERVFTKLRDDGRLWGHIIRGEFGAGQAGRLLSFVGRDVYVAAGGALIEDLFGEDHVISDAELVARLARERLRAECEQLVADGWSWAAIEDELPPGTYSWERLNPPQPEPTKTEAKRIKALSKIIAAAEDAEQEGDLSTEQAAAHQAAVAEMEAIEAAIDARKFDAEAKARSGCIVSISNSDLYIKFGVLKPGTKKTAVKPADGEAPAEKAAPKLSNALHERLSIQLTEAVQVAIRGEREVALAALLAGFLAGKYADPVHVSTQGHGGRCSDAGDYADVFAGLLGKPIDELLEITGAVVATAVSLRRQVVQQPPLADLGIVALCDAIDPERLVAAARETFDAADYFGGANKALVLRAIEEAINADEARKIGGKPKPEIVAFAIANVPATGWLPPELRTKGYVVGAS